MKHDPLVTFITATPINEKCFISAAAIDAFEPFYPYTRLFIYDEEEEPSHLWSFQTEKQVIRSTCIYKDPKDNYRYFAYSSEEGEVTIMTEDLIKEVIPDAGVNRDDSAGFGYISNIQQIGIHLYACGFSGQVYKRHGSNDWKHMDEGLLQKSGTPMDEVIALTKINGFDENSIYAAGYQYTDWFPPKVFFFNGIKWKEIIMPEVVERITDIYIESPQRIWMCGANGTLIVGNADDGFQSLSTINDNKLFTSISKFKNDIYLASDAGLFIYNPNDHELGIKKVTSTLHPDIQDANIVSPHGNVLWSIGHKDINRFDGKNWERIHHPDNKKIG